MSFNGKPRSLKPSTPQFSPDDYDQHGVLRLPWWFWGVLILQARTWILFVMAGASRDQGARLLQLFYPDTQRFWFGMLLGLPAALAFVISGRRQHWPRLWWCWRWALVIAVTVALLGSAHGLWQQEITEPPVEMLLVLLDALALAYLLLNQRLIACFSQRGEASL